MKFNQALDLRETALPRIIVDWETGDALFSDLHPGVVKLDVGNVTNPLYIQGTLTLDDGWEVDAYIDEGLDDSSKQWTVPVGWLWQVLFIGVTLTTSGAAGNRQIDVRLQRAGTAMWVQLARAGAVQATTLTYYYLFAAGVADLTAVRDSTYLPSPLPVGLILRGGDTLRVWDNKPIAGAADDMSVWFQFAKKEL